MANSEEIAAALEAAGSEEQSETPTGSEEEKATESKDVKSLEDADASESRKGKNAADRIQELVGTRKELEAKLEELNDTLKERDVELGNLTEAIKNRDYYERVVNRINELHKDPEWTEEIERLDAAIRGEKVERGETPKSDDEVNESILKTARDELQRQILAQDEKLADQTINMLTMQADEIIDSLISELPEAEYNETDRQIVQSTLDDQVNWEAIEEDPSSLRSEIKKAFQSTVDWYGVPKGKLEASVKTETTDEETTPAKKEITVEEIANKQWGKLKTVKRGDKEVLEPAVSNEDFDAVLGEIIRRTR